MILCCQNSKIYLELDSNKVLPKFWNLWQNVLPALVIQSPSGMIIGPSLASKIDSLSFTLLPEKPRAQSDIFWKVKSVECSPYHCQYRHQTNLTPSWMEEGKKWMEEGNWEPETQDKWSYKWNSDNFSTKKAYCLLQGTQPASPLFPWLWSSGTLGKTQVLLLAPSQGQVKHRKFAQEKE